MDEETSTATETATPDIAPETAPAKEPWQEANDLAADVIAEIANEFQADADAPAGEEGQEGGSPAVPGDTSDVGETDAAGTDVVADAPEEPETKPEEERGLSRLVEREVEIRRREDAIAAREQQVSKYETRLAELEAKAQTYQGDFHEHLRQRPTEALKAAGHDPDQIVRVYLAEKLQREGKPVPPELRSAIEKAEQTFETAKLRRELQDFQQRQAAQQFVAAIEAGARTYVSTPEISKHAPTVASVAAKHPERVYREIMDEIARDAQGKAGKEPNAPVLTYEEAAKRVEKRWIEFQSLFNAAPPSQNAPPAASTNAGGKAPTPVTSAPKGNPGASKPKGNSPKPLMPKKPATQAELEKAAIDAGIAEFKRVEAAKKATA